MGLRILLVVAIGAAMAACQRSESPPASVPTPHATVLPSPRAAEPTSTTAVAPSPAPSADAEDDDDEDDIDKPWGTEFEIDADADRYFSYAPVTIMFGARPLNGTPPFTYAWDMGDGSPPLTGKVVAHTYDKPGTYRPYVVGKDGKGETYRVSFLVVIVSREDYVARKGIDPATLPVQSPIPTTTPGPG